MRLALVLSTQDRDAIGGLIGVSGSVWVGASDLAVEGDWRWVDGSPVARGTSWWESGALIQIVLLDLIDSRVLFLI